MHVLIEGTAHVDCKKVRFYIFIGATLDKTWAPDRPYSMQRSRGAAGIRWRLVEGSRARSFCCQCRLLECLALRARRFCGTSARGSLSQVLKRSCLRGVSLFYNVFLVGRRCIQF